MYQPLIKFHPHPAIITQVLRIFVESPVGLWAQTPDEKHSGLHPTAPLYN